MAKKKVWVKKEDNNSSSKENLHQESGTIKNKEIPTSKLKSALYGSKSIGKKLTRTIYNSKD